MAIYRRPVRRSRKITKKRFSKKPKVSQTIKKYVKKAIHTNIENKMFTGYNSNQPISTVNGSNVPQYVSLAPAIALGMTVQNRIGNEIRIVKGQARIVVNLLPYALLSNTAIVPLLVRVIFFSLKQSNTNALTSTFTNNFWQVGSTSVGPQGNILDMLYTPNKELMTVYKDTKFRIGASYVTSTSPVTSNGYYDNSPMTKSLTFNWGKYFKRKIKYDDTSTVSVNANLFAIFFCVAADGSTSGAQVSAEYHHVNYVEYEDA